MNDKYLTRIMQLAIISLNSKVIYLEVRSLESYRRLGSIFRTKENEIYVLTRLRTKNSNPVCPIVIYGTRRICV